MFHRSGSIVLILHAVVVCVFADYSSNTIAYYSYNVYDVYAYTVYKYIHLERESVCVCTFKIGITVYQKFNHM